MQRIFLIGYMGCGKTTLGRKIAARLGIAFVDLDKVIEAKYHKTVSEIFAEFGQEYFRKIEHNTLLEVADYENVLISTGGGTPCYFNNMDIMNNCGDTVYISLKPEELATRFTKSNVAKRPLLKEKDGAEMIEFIKNTLAERENFYMQAKYIINGMDKDIVGKIVRIIRN
jgi:Shikimate kinase